MTAVNGMGLAVIADLQESIRSLAHSLLEEVPDYPRIKNDLLQLQYLAFVAALEGATPALLDRPLDRLSVKLRTPRFDRVAAARELLGVSEQLDRGLA